MASQGKELERNNDSNTSYFSEAPAVHEEIEFINPPPNLECPICLTVPIQPHIVSCCGEKICSACITRVQYANQPCPVCREVRFTTMLEKQLYRMILGLQVCCTYSKDGCQWSGELREMYKHRNTDNGDCQFVEMPCPFGCSRSFPRCQIDEHGLSCDKAPPELKRTQKLILHLKDEFQTALTETKNEAKKQIDLLKEEHTQQLKNVKEEHNKQMEEMKHQIKEEHKIQLEEMRCQIEKKFSIETQGNPMVEIGGVKFSVLQLPAPSSIVVKERKAEILFSFDLPAFEDAVGHLAKSINVAYFGSDKSTQKQVQIIARELKLLNLEKISISLQGMLHCLPFPLSSSLVPPQMTTVYDRTKEMEAILLILERKCQDMSTACKSYFEALMYGRSTEIAAVVKSIATGFTFCACYWQLLGHSCRDLTSTVNGLQMACKKIQEKEITILSSSGFKLQLIQYYAAVIALSDVCSVGIEKFKLLQLTISCISDPLSFDEAKRLAQAMIY